MNTANDQLVGDDPGACAPPKDLASIGNRQSAMANRQWAIGNGQLPSGFTVIELLIALGILVIGASMIATSFPSGLLENKESSETTFATIINENAVSLCRGRFSYSPTNNTVNITNTVTGLVIPATLTDLSATIFTGTSSDRQYPYPLSAAPANRLYGFVVAARQVTVGKDDFQLAVVSYRKHVPADPAPVFSAATVELVFTGATVTGNIALVGTSTTPVSVGAPVIMSTGPSAGEWATVTRTDGTLSRILRRDALASDAAITLNNTTGGLSPAIGCLVLRTSLP